MEFLRDSLCSNDYSSFLVNPLESDAWIHHREVEGCKSQLKGSNSFSTNFSSINPAKMCSPPVEKFEQDTERSMGR